jgi:hypothetical protein
MDLIHYLFGWKPLIVVIGKDSADLPIDSLHRLGIIQVRYHPDQKALLYQQEVLQLCELPGLPTCPCIVISPGIENVSAVDPILETWKGLHDRPVVIKHDDSVVIETLNHIVESCLQQVERSGKAYASLLQQIAALRDEVSRAQRIASERIAGHEAHSTQLDIVLPPDTELIAIPHDYPLTFFIPYPVWGLKRLDLMLDAGDGSGMIEVSVLSSEGNYELGAWELDCRALPMGWQRFDLTSASAYTGFGLLIKARTRGEGGKPKLTLAATAPLPQSDAAIHGSSLWSVLPAIRLWRSGVPV